MQIHITISDRSYNYFVKKGVDEYTAKAYTFAIAFYTGTYSEVLNRNTALMVRNPNRHASINTKINEMGDKAAIIIYYLIKALSHIDFYWGIVTRSVELSEKELAHYQPGALITWIQFSSSNKGLKVPSWFTERNTVFLIYSLTGRSIQQFSNYPDAEDEILFLPHSSFLVCDVKSVNNKTHIYLRQLELGLCKYVILWVDDHIFDEHWENKAHMERAKSEFGQKLKAKRTFRIVTDMNRTNELPGYNAGARLIYQIRKRGFDHECLIFTSDLSEGKGKLADVFQEEPMNKIQVSTRTSDLDKFVQFK